MTRSLRTTIFAAVVLAASCCQALAQTSPNFTYGFVPTVAQWNSLFAGKQDYLGSPPLLTTGGTMTGPLVTTAPTASSSGFNLPPGTAPTSPNNGDLWGTPAGLFYQVGGVTVPLTGASSSSFTASNPLAVSFPSVGVVNYALNINTSLALDGGNNLGINLAHANTWTAAQQFNLNSGAPVAPTFSSPIQIVGADATITAITFDTYGAAGIIAMRTSGGTRASKTAVTSGSQISNLQGNGWNGTAYAGVSAFVQFAGENWSGTANGTYTSFFTAALTTTAQTEKMRLQPSGGLTLGNSIITTDPGAGSLLQSGFHTVQGTSSPSTAAGNTVVTGTLSAAPSLSGNGQTALFNTAVGGASLQGVGSTSDVSILNKSGTIVATVPTGTTTFNLPSLSAVGTCSGSLLLDTSKNVTTGACPGAAGSIQVGVTNVTSGTTLNVLYNNAGVLANATITGPLQLSAGALSINGSLTAHSLLIGQGTGAITNTGAGTLGQFAASNGASADPTFKNGPWTLINTLTASGSSTLSDTTSLTASYSEYWIEIKEFIPAANAATLELQINSGGVKVAGYLGSVNGNVSSTTALNTNPTTYIPINNTGFGSNLAPGLSADIYVSDPSVSTITLFHGTSFGPTGNPITATQWSAFNGFWNTAGVITGFQLCYSSSTPTCNVNTTSGIVKIYGRL